MHKNCAQCVLNAKEVYKLLIFLQISALQIVSNSYARNGFYCIIFKSHLFSVYLSPSVCVSACLPALAQVIVVWSPTRCSRALTT